MICEVCGDEIDFRATLFHPQNACWKCINAAWYPLKKRLKDVQFDGHALCIVCGQYLTKGEGGFIFSKPYLYDGKKWKALQHTVCPPKRK